MKIGIGIPCYTSVAPEVLFDYMRMSYHFGRRMPDHEFFIITKTKSEQYRARNAIVESALKFGLDYLLMLDDDQIIDWQEYPKWNSYDFLEKLLAHNKAVVGCLYYHRGGLFAPVLMKKIERKDQPDAYRFMTDHEVEGKLQEVDVQGGGCMLVNMEVFKKILPPYFEPEIQSPEMGGNRYGTDIQLCRKAQDLGYKVYCDSSIVVGHLKQDREPVTPYNRDAFLSMATLKENALRDWNNHEWLKRLHKDAEIFSGLTMDELLKRGMDYIEKYLPKFGEYENPDDYYRDLGVDQVARQVWFHSKGFMIKQSMTIMNYFLKGEASQGIDFGCGCAPVGFELLKMGYKMDFIDVEGASGLEFLKWRIKKYSLEDRAGFKIGPSYKFLLLLDSLEHIENWEPVLDDLLGRLTRGAGVFTNFFLNTDYSNPEHVNMDKQRVGDFMVSRGLKPITELLWVKETFRIGGAQNIDNVGGARNG